MALQNKQLLELVAKSKNSDEQYKSILISILSTASPTASGELILECLDCYDCFNTQQLTIEMLEEFINNNDIEID